MITDLGAFFALMLPAGIVLTVAVGLALGLALTGHGSDADWVEPPSRDWRQP